MSPEGRVTNSQIVLVGEKSPSDITLPSALAAPSRPEPFWFLPGCSLLARMQCERLACHLGFSGAPENRGGQPWSSLLPAHQCVQLFGQARRAHPCGRRSCAE